MDLSPRSLAKRLLDSWAFFRLLEILDHRSDNRMSEFGMISQAFEFKKINGVEGDYFEFGLWRGKTFCFAHRMKRRYSLADMRFFGFDSFQGLPPVESHRDNIWEKGQFACSEPEFRKILQRNKFRPDEYELFPGFYEKSLNGATHARLAGRKAAIVYIDYDLYESTKCVLKFIAPFLGSGSIVCFDDYYCYKGAPDQGEQRALTEFLESQNAIQFLPYLDYSPLGKSFIVRTA